MAINQTVSIRIEKAPSMARAIKEKCLDCCGGVLSEVRECRAANCPLFPYRFGKNPRAAIRYLEQYYTVEVITAAKQKGAAK